VSIDLTKARFKEGRAFPILIPLLILNLALLSVQIEDPAGTYLFRKWMLQAGAPFFKLSSGVSHGVRSAWTGYFWLRGARQENERLLEKVRQLELRNDAVAQIENENYRLQRLMDFKKTLAVQSLGARVVGRAPDYMASVIYIDRGSSDGVRVNAPVIGENGVLGRVAVASSRTSQVQLVTDADAAVGALVERTRSQGVISGSGDPLLELKYIGNTDQVEVNDVVVTSGLDGIFPKGLPLGRVVESQKGKTVFRLVRVQPVADLIHIEEVLVLLASAPAHEE